MTPKYLPTSADEKQLERSFTYHPPSDCQAVRYQLLRTEGGRFANVLLHQCPASRERDIAMASIEEAVMWANASIARGETTTHGVTKPRPPEGS